jgi:transposase-like protein
MAWGKKQRRIEALEYRVRELEERLCPCESHDWRKIGTRSFSNGVDLDFEYKYKCAKCGKITWDWR